jgi:uncharacterized protein (UPF0218 family)
MVKISESARIELKKPLGRLIKDTESLYEITKNHKIVTVGDICTLTLLRKGIKPHLAVYDYRYKRMRLDELDIEKLKDEYPAPRSFVNPAGSVSSELLKEAENLLEEGGAILIDGEDDLSALAFIRAASAEYLILYGQPDQGIVVVVPDKKTKEKIERLFQ